MKKAKILNYACALLALVVLVMTFLPYWKISATQMREALPELAAKADLYAEAVAASEAAKAAKNAGAAVVETEDAEEAVEGEETVADEEAVEGEEVAADEEAVEGEEAAADEEAVESEEAAPVVNLNDVEKVEPFTDINASIEAFVWLPNDQLYLVDYFGAIDEGFNVNVLAISIAVLVVFCVAAVFACVKFSSNGLAAVTSLVGGAAGLLAYRLCAVLNLGVSSLPTVIQVLCGVLVAISLVNVVLGLIAKKQEEEA